MGMDIEPYSWFITSFRYLESQQGTAGATEYFKRLASQELEWRKGHSLIGQLIAAGEFPIGVEMQAGSVERLKAQGAPIDWVALDGVTPINNVGVSVTAAGANTHAAVLYYDFLLSRTGMEIMKARNRIPTRPGCNRPLSEALQAAAVRCAGSRTLRPVRRPIQRTAQAALMKLPIRVQTVQDV